MVRAVFILLMLISVSAGQNYDFSVPEFTCRVEINGDRSIDIEYEILFQTTPGYRSIDIVDIGFPSGNYDISTVEAWVGTVSLTRIYPSEYIDNGVEVHLGSEEIRPGERRLFRLRGSNPNMVFRDTESDGYASMEFSPTWFEPGLLTGESEFRLEILFPQGADPDLVRHHARPFTEAFLDEEGGVVYVWETVRRVDHPFLVGVSFPDHLVDGPLPERPKPPPISAETLIIIVSLAFPFMFFAFVILMIIRSVRAANRRKEMYLPPKLGLEGSGIRRGLTAPMAALLLQEKLDRVMTLIVFGLLKKGNLRLEEGSLKKTEEPEGGLRSYEKDLIGAMTEKGTIPAGKAEPIFVRMIEELEKKMEGFSLKETREYYRSVIRNAWKMVDRDHSAERLGEIFSDRFQWLLADSGFDRRARDLPEERRAVLPIYMYGYFPGRTGAGTSTGGSLSLSKACSELAGVIEGAAGRAVSGITSLARSVTARTNPVPVHTSRGSSGSGCACACACAGCACACAGGGR